MPVIRLFVEQLMRTHIKETFKSVLLAPREGKSPVTAQMANNAEKLPFDDVVMETIAA